MHTTIALVEDHAALREELVFHLHHAGHTVTGLPDGAALDQHLAQHPCDLVLLDLGLPGEDGLSIAARLRRDRPGLGLIMLTARGMFHERLQGLQGGADAYLVKPVDPAELLAVIANLLGRLRPETAPADWCFDPHTLRLRAPDGASILLTHMDGQLLSTLARHAPAPVSRHRLIADLGGTTLDFAEHRLEVAISRLRQKMTRVGAKSTAIRAARGTGYRLCLSVRFCELSPSEAS